MKKCNKIISSIVLVCFIFNTAISDFAFGQSLNIGIADKLAPQSKFSNIQDIGNKDMGDIELWFAAALNYINDHRLEITRENLQKFADMPGNLPGKTIYQLGGAQFFIHEIPSAEDGVLKIKAVRKDLAYGARTYIIEYSSVNQQLDVYPEGSDGKAKPKTASSIKAAGIYTQHEKVDGILDYAHRGGLTLTAEEARFDYKGTIADIISELKLDIENPGGMAPLQDRKFYLVPLTGKIASMLNESRVEHETKNGAKQKVIVHTHSSNNAVHLFLNREAIDDLKRGGARAKFVEGRIKDYLVHEVGAMLGLSVLRFIDSRPENEIDVRHNELLLKGRKAEFKRKKYYIANLDTNLAARDYAAGATTQAAAPEAKVRILFADDPEDPKTIDAIREKLSERFGGRVEFITEHGKGKDAEWLKARIRNDKPDTIVVRSATTAFDGKDPSIFELAENNGLKAIIRAGVGYENIKDDMAANHGISVGRTHGSANSVADLTLSFLLGYMCKKRGVKGARGGVSSGSAFDNHIEGLFQTGPGEYEKLVRNSKKWAVVPEGERDRLTDYWMREIVDPLATDSFESSAEALRGKTIGILGWGAIGRAVAQKLKAIADARDIPFTVLVHSRSLTPDSAEAKKLGAAPVSREELFKRANMVTIHLGAKQEDMPKVQLTEAEISSPNLELLINTSRSGYARPELLEPRVKAGGLAYYGDLDMTPELYRLIETNRDNAVIFPHIAASTRDGANGVEARTAPALVDMIELILDGEILSGEPTLEIVNGVAPRPIFQKQPAAERERIVTQMTKMLSPLNPDIDYNKLLVGVKAGGYLVATNLNDERRADYARDGKVRALPPTFIFDGSILTGYRGGIDGIDRPRYIVVTSLPDGAAITTIFSRTKNPKMIFAKGGCRWYQVGEYAGKSTLDSMDEKFMGNPEKTQDPLLLEGVRLANAMFYKSPFWETYFDGGKTIFLADRNADKESFIRDWAASSMLAGCLMNLYLGGPDVGMEYEQMGWIEDEKIAARRVFGMQETQIISTTSRDPETTGTFPHVEWMATSIAVVETLAAALDNTELMKRFKIDENNLTMGIVGFGDVGGGVLRYLHDKYPDIFAKVKITAAADSKGTIYNREGLDKKQLLRLIKVRERAGRKFALKDYYKGEFEFMEDTRKAYFLGSTILIPAAKGTVVFGEEDIRRMAEAGTKIISEGANNFAAIGTEDKFEAGGILYFYGPVANGGGIYSSKEEVFHAMLEPEIFRVMSDANRDRIRKRMAELKPHIQGDIADTALVNARWLSDQFVIGRGASIYEIHQRVVNDIITERSRLLDEPAAEEDREISARVERDVKHGIARNDENLRVLTIIHATEIARENIMGKYIDKGVVARELDAQDLDGLADGRKIRALMFAAYWAGKLKMNEAADNLLRIIGSKTDSSLRRLAAISLGYINSPATEEALARLETTPGVAGCPDVLIGVRWALDHMRDTAAAKTPTEDAQAQQANTDFAGLIAGEQYKKAAEELREAIASYVKEGSLLPFQKDEAKVDRLYTELSGMCRMLSFTPEGMNFLSSADYAAVPAFMRIQLAKYFGLPVGGKTIGEGPEKTRVLFDYYAAVKFRADYVRKDDGINPADYVVVKLDGENGYLVIDRIDRIGFYIMPSAEGRAALLAHLPLSPDIQINVPGYIKVKPVALEAMERLAAKAGRDIPTFPEERYTLLLTSEFFANGELEAHRLKYGDRFNLDRVSGSNPAQFVENILSKAKGVENRTIALVPDSLEEAELDRLKGAGIRFIRANAWTLLNARSDKDSYREKFQLDTYAMMLLARRISRDITRDSSIYQVLSFYIKTHFKLADDVAAADYIEAIMTGDVARLLKGILSYRPAEPYDRPDYNNVAAALIAA
ncbi:MAG: NAD(P)-dependent oxidoreductase [Candidatus Omnitrophota bacterium]